MVGEERTMPMVLLMPGRRGIVVVAHGYFAAMQALSSTPLPVPHLP